jgi:peptidyl-dipeptidase A
LKTTFLVHKRCSFVNRPPRRDAPDWAAKILVAIVPVYYHNYVLGNLISAQLRDYLEARVTAGEPYFASEAAGRYLQEAVFGPGARNGWQDTVIGTTGEKLNPDYFVTSLL